jgi:MFS family permease
MNGVAGIFGGLLGYAVGHITTGLSQWMYIFLIFGSVSLAWSFVFLALMPDLPSRARFLTESERIVAVERVAGESEIFSPVVGFTSLSLLAIIGEKIA